MRVCVALCAAVLQHGEKNAHESPLNIFRDLKKFYISDLFVFKI